MTSSKGALNQILCFALSAYTLILLARVLLSWFRPPLSGSLRVAWDLIHAVTEPVLAPLRKVLPPLQAGGMGIDFSPVLAFVALAVLQRVIC